MKTTFFLLICFSLIAFFACNSNPKPVELQTNMKDKSYQFDTANFTTIQWLDSNINIGTISNGEKKDIKFRFLNSGDKPLYLYSVLPTCGCTIADYTKSAVMPRKQGEVTAVFNSKNQSHEFRKVITVQSNTRNKPVSSLVFTGTIKDSIK